MKKQSIKIHPSESKIHFESALHLGLNFTYEQYKKSIINGKLMYRICLN